MLLWKHTSLHLETFLCAETFNFRDSFQKWSKMYFLTEAHINSYPFTLSVYLKHLPDKSVHVEEKKHNNVLTYVAFSYLLCHTYAFSDQCLHYVLQCLRGLHATLQPACQNKNRNASRSLPFNILFLSQTVCIRLFFEVYAKWLVFFACPVSKLTWLLLIFWKRFVWSDTETLRLFTLDLMIISVFI